MILYFQQQGMKVPFFHILIIIIFCRFYYSHDSEGEVISRYGFGFQSPNEVLFQLPMSHLDVCIWRNIYLNPLPIFKMGYLLTVLVNKVLLEYSYIHLFTYFCGCFCLQLQS